MKRLSLVVGGAMLLGGGLTACEDAAVSPTSIDIVSEHNTAPVANAGQALVLGEGILSGGEVSLDGRASYDPDGDALGFSWRQVEGPSVELRDADSAQPTFEAPRVDETLVFELVVNDGAASSSPTRVSVEALSYGGESATVGQHPFRSGLSLEGRTQAVTVEGGRAFVSTYEGTVHAVDIQDPTDPTWLSTYETPGQALDVLAQGEVLFVADGYRGLFCMDISDPAGGREMGVSQGAGAAVKLAIQGDRAYLAGRHMGLQVVDVADPSVPAQLSQQYIHGLTQDLAVDGRWVYMATGYTGLAIADATDPTQVEVVGHLELGFANALALEDKIAYVLTQQNTLVIVDVSDPAAPVELTTVELGTVALDVVVSEGIAYLAHNDQGVMAIDVSEPGTPRVLRTFKIPGEARGLALVADRLFVANGEGLQIIDLSTVTSPRWSDNRLSLPDALQGMVIAGRKAYVAGEQMLRIFDLSDPNAPELLGSVHQPLSALTVHGDRLYGTDPRGSIVSLDVSDPTNPHMADYRWRHGETEDIAVTPSGEFLLLAGGPQGIAVYDLKGGLNWVADVDTGGVVHGIAFSEGLTYLADEVGGIFALDLSDPRAPVVIDSYNPLGRVHGVAAVPGAALYVAHGEGGVLVLTLESGGGFGAIEALETQGAAMGVEVYENDLMVNGARGAVEIFDVKDPSVPTRSGAFERHTTGGVVASWQGVRYLSDADHGLVIVPPFEGTLNEDGDEVLPGHILAWTFTDFDPALNVACTATAGDCEVLAVDAGLGEAVIRWRAPSTPGDHEIAIAIGEHDFFEIVARDKVFVR